MSVAIMERLNLGPCTEQECSVWGSRSIKKRKSYGVRIHDRAKLKTRKRNLGHDHWHWNTGLSEKGCRAVTEEVARSKRYAVPGWLHPNQNLDKSMGRRVATATRETWGAGTLVSTTIAKRDLRTPEGRLSSNNSKSSMRQQQHQHLVSIPVKGITR